MTNIRKNISSFLFFLSRTRNFLPLEARKLLYFSHVHSRLIYCLPLFTLLRITDMNALCTLQRKAIRITYNVSQRSSAIDYFHDLGILPLDVQLEKDIIKFLQNIHSYGEPKDLVEYFEVKVSSEVPYNLRDCLKFKLPLVKSIRLSSSPIFSYPFIFNKFSGDFKFVMERKDFLEKLELYFSRFISSKDCKKAFCKICNRKLYLERISRFYTQPKTYNYHRYS